MTCVFFFLLFFCFKEFFNIQNVLAFFFFFFIADQNYRVILVLHEVDYEPQTKLCF